MNTSTIKAFFNEHRQILQALGVMIIMFAAFFYVFHPFRQMEIQSYPWKKMEIQQIYKMISNPYFATGEQAYYCPQYLALTSSPLTELHFYYKSELFAEVETVQSYKSICQKWLPVFYEHYKQKQSDPKPIGAFYSTTLWDTILANLYDDNRNTYIKEYREQRMLYVKNASNCHLTKDKKNVQCQMEFESKNAFEKENMDKEVNS